MSFTGEEKGLSRATWFKVGYWYKDEADMGKGVVTLLHVAQESRVTSRQYRINGFLEIYQDSRTNLRCFIEVATAFAAKVWRGGIELAMFTLQSKVTWIRFSHSTVTCIYFVSESVNSTSHVEPDIFASDSHRFQMLYWIRYISDFLERNSKQLWLNSRVNEENRSGETWKAAVMELVSGGMPIYST